jgi:hypothetical protein
MEKLKTEILGKIDLSVGSMFTKDDVKVLVEEIFTDVENNSNKIDLDDIVKTFEYRLNKRNNDDIIDFGSAEFGIDGNQIILEAVSYNTDVIIDILEDIVRDLKY